MPDVTTHDDGNAEGRRPTTADEEIADALVGATTANEVLDLLASLNAADGANYLDIFNEACREADN